eukprot:2143591-Amphidinium_carterae.1
MGWTQVLSPWVVELDLGPVVLLWQPWSTQRALLSDLLAVASDLLAVASDLLAVASDQLAVASDQLAVASHSLLWTLGRTPNK